MPRKRMAHGKPSSTWARRFMDKFKWSERKITAPGNYLHYDHPKNQRWREHFKLKRETEGFEMKLTLNYDQVWRLKYRGHDKKVWKTRSAAGKQRHRLEGASGRMRVLKRTTKHIRARGKDEGMTLDEDEDSIIDTSHAGTEAAKRRREGRHDHDEVATVPIMQQRMPHTCTTNLWADGTPGPLLFVFGEGMFPADRIKELSAAMLSLHRFSDTC